MVPFAEGQTHRRVQLDMGQRSYRRMEALKEKTGVKTWADVISDAMRLYEAVIDDASKGYEFVARKPNGETVSYRILIDPIDEQTA